MRTTVLASAVLAFSSAALVAQTGRTWDKTYNLSGRATLHISAGGEVELVNAGHVSPVVWSPGGSTRIVEDGDVPVGLLPGAEFHAVRFSLAPGGRLLLLSDGVTEAENPEGEEFGVAGAAAHLGSAHASEAVLTALVEHCRGVKAADDRTILCIERMG